MRSTAERFCDAIAAGAELTARAASVGVEDIVANMLDHLGLSHEQILGAHCIGGHPLRLSGDEGGSDFQPVDGFAFVDGSEALCINGRWAAITADEYVALMQRAREGSDNL